MAMIEGSSVKIGRRERGRARRGGPREVLQGRKFLSGLGMSSVKPTAGNEAVEDEGERERKLAT